MPFGISSTARPIRNRIVRLRGIPMADEQRIGLHSLKPPRGSRRPRKRIGRGQGSGFGKTAGRGQKGAGARSGNRRKVGHEGGQNPLHMRMRKLRGPYKKQSMPFEPFRTRTQPVNLSDLNRFDDNADVTPETLRAGGLAKRKRIPVKILGRGELERKGLTVTAHAFSATAREKIEAAGGTCNVVERGLRSNGEAAAA
jgi:large subunit ribosomal protein L15